MSNLLENLRNQPDNEKNKLAQLIFIICVIVVFILFGLVLKERFSNPQTLNGFKEDVKPFQQLSGSLQGNFNNQEKQ